MDLSPRQIVDELDKYIIGQKEAKKAVAVALRNRYRRSQLSKEQREEITPKNIIMKGPTGVGKTEIARRLAKLVGAPFVKIEATKYTEVGYVGRDVESMVRDLVSVSVRMVETEMQAKVAEKAKKNVDEKLLRAYITAKQKEREQQQDAPALDEEKIKNDYYAGKLEDVSVELEIVEAQKSLDMPGMEGVNLGGMIQGFFPPRRKKRKLTVKEARKLLVQEESDKLIDHDAVNTEAIRRAEEEGIIFIDEMDKIVGKGSASNGGPDVSREGVQRDILPIVEGSTVNTKYGNIKTDFILFIAAGAFHVSKIEDMIPELQGRFPIRVDLASLTKVDFVNILTKPKNAVTVQYADLLRVDNVNISFTEDAIDEIAELAYNENETSENIGARRLHTIIEKLLEEISFNACKKNHEMLDVKIDKGYVQKVFDGIKKKHDLKKYIL